MMKTLIKILLQGAAIFTIGFFTHTFNSAQATYDDSDNKIDITHDDSSSVDNESEVSQSDNHDGEDLADSKDEISQDVTHNDSGSSDNEGTSSQETEVQQSVGSTLQVQVKIDMSGEYQQMLTKEQEKFQIFLRALSNPDNSKQGSKPVRLDLNGGEAKFDDIAKDQPQGVLVALSKVGNSYHYFCSGKGMKNGVITGFPKGISITLKNANTPYKTNAGVLRNDSYPNCEVEIQN